MIIIREARKSDLNDIKELNWKIHLFYVKNRFHPLIKVVNKKTKSWGRRFVSRTFQSKKWKYFVADNNGKLVGFISGKIDKYPPIFTERKYGWLWILYVDEPYRRRGLGKKLVIKFLKWLKQNKVIFVITDVSPLNFISIKLFSKLGFGELWKEVGKRI